MTSTPASFEVNTKSISPNASDNLHPIDLPQQLFKPYGDWGSVRDHAADLIAGDHLLRGLPLREAVERATLIAYNIAHDNGYALLVTPIHLAAALDKLRDEASADDTTLQMLHAMLARSEQGLL